MKKLMIAAALAAMATGASATGIAQVYDMTINVKTTECKDNKKALTDKCGRSYRFYRAQTSYKFEGKFWGCGCPTIANPIPEQYGYPRIDSGLAADEMDCENNNNSYMFWGKKAAFHKVDFTWDLLQLVGKKNENVEGVFGMKFYVCDDGDIVEDVSLDLVGAGYGTATLNGEDAQAFNTVKSMSGSVVGIYNVADVAGVVGCTYCGLTVDCGPYEFCPCVGTRDTESAAYGTFAIKYNSGLSDKVNKGKYIDEAYKFPAFVTEEFKCIAENAEPEGPTACDEATGKLEELEKELKDLEGDYETLTASILKYKKIAADCESTNAVLVAEAKKASTVYTAQTNANATTHWAIVYKNASHDKVTENGTGLEDFDAKVAELKYFTFVTAGYGYKTFKSWAAAEDYIDDKVETTEKLANELEKAERDVESNKKVWDLALLGVETDTKKLEDLDYYNRKIQLNSQIGAQKVVVDLACD